MWNSKLISITFRKSNTVLHPGVRLGTRSASFRAGLISVRKFLHCVSKKLTLLFLWLLYQTLTDFNDIWQYCSWENLQTKDILLSYNIQFVYEYHRIEKRKIFHVISMLPLHLAGVKVSCSFFKSLFSPQHLFRNSLTSFFSSTSFLSKFNLCRWNPCLLHHTTDTKPSNARSISN